MSNNYIINKLKTIYLIQNKSTNSLYNTRPINIYTKHGSLFTININDINIYTFRIKKITDNYIILQALINTEGNLEAIPNYIKININCICAIRCLNDVFINNL